MIFSEITDLNYQLYYMVAKSYLNMLIFIVQTLFLCCIGPSIHKSPSLLTKPKEKNTWDRFSLLNFLRIFRSS